MKTENINKSNINKSKASLKTTIQFIPGLKFEFPVLYCLFRIISLVSKEFRELLQSHIKDASETS